MSEQETKVPPALTAEGWEERRYAPISCSEIVLHDDGDGMEFVTYANGAARAARRGLLGKYKLERWAPEDYRAMSALLLQCAGPEGGPLLTHEMVDAIENAYHCIYEDYRLYKEGREEDAADLARLLHVAAALRSLLPPRDA
jgi:hypothetical protein